MEEVKIIQLYNGDRKNYMSLISIIFLMFLFHHAAWFLMVYLFYLLSMYCYAFFLEMPENYNSLGWGVFLTVLH